MSLQEFDVKFDNPHATYYAGQTVTGRVVVKLARDKKIRGIVIQVRGEAEVKWIESKSKIKYGKRHIPHETFRSHELYFEQLFQAVGQSEGEMVLPAGNHEFPFSVALPQNIPASFEGAWGYVRYTFKATIERPWKFDHELKTAFTVLTSLDLNTEENLPEPAKKTAEKTLWCWCCKQGPITLVANLPVTAFVPGQKIPGVVELDNLSSSAVTVKCQLVKHVKFTARHESSTRHKYDEIVVAEETLGKVKAHGSHTLHIDLTVPALPASHLPFCNCIDIYYKIVVSGNFSLLHKKIHIGVPVVIGNIPLKGLFPAMIPSAEPSVPASKEEEKGKGETVLPSDPSANPFGAYPDMPNPSYEECMVRKTNIRNEDDSSYMLGPTDFAPRYPTYRFK